MSAPVAKPRQCRRQTGDFRCSAAGVSRETQDGRVDAAISAVPLRVDTAPGKEVVIEVRIPCIAQTQASAPGETQSGAWPAQKKGRPVAVGYAASDGAGCQGDRHAARKTDWREFRNLSDIEADHRYRRLVEAVQDYAIFMLDLSGNVTSWNPGAQRAKGYSAEEITGRHFSLFYTSEDVAVGKPLSPNVFSSCDWER